jgi:NAD(P)-dependent dehydrogenase (short-subunit alcohol dehydrogenase family)
MLKSFRDKVVAITGGSTGIGRATMDLLRERGATVYNLDIQPDGCPGDFYIFCDVTDHASVSEAIERVVSREGKIDALFANAGVHLFANLEETTFEEFETVLSINLKGVFYTLKAVIPVMKKQSHGVILLIGSDQTLIGKGRSSVYGLTKGAIGQLAKSTAIDYAPFNIRVNCLCAGTTDTPLMWKAVTRYHKLSGLPEEKIKAGLDQAQPIPHVARPEEIAKVACFLLSDESSYVTGALVAADGGYTAQ